MLTGDFQKLAALKERLEAAAELKLAGADRVAEKFEEQLEHQYDSGTDPHNEGWAELGAATLAKGRTPPPLTDTGEMRRNSKAVSGLAGIRVSVDKPSKPLVPSLHQKGTENMPQRQIVPEPRAALPVAWKAAAEIGAGEAVVEHFGGLL